MKSKRFAAMFLCFTTCFAAFFGYMHGDTYAQYEDIVYDYVTVEDGKVVGGNAELVENGIIAIGTPEKNAEPTNEPTESLTNTTDTEASVIPSVDVSLPEAESADDTRFEAESVYTEETTPGKDIADVKDNALVTGKNDTESTVPEIAPNAVSPDVPTETVKLAMNYTNRHAWNNKQLSSYSTLNNASTELVWGSDSSIYSIYSIQINSGQSLTMKIASNISHSCGVTRLDDLKDYPVFLVNGGTLNISGISSNYFVINGNQSYTNQTPSNESDPLIVLSSGTVTLNYVNLNRNTCGSNELRNPDTGHGSAICMNNGTMNLNNVSINNCGFHNDVEVARGVVFVGGGTANFNNVDIYNNNLSNIEQSYGGGIYVGGGTVTYNGGQIYNNSVSTDGGGICCYGGTVNITGGEIHSNSAPHGGGLYVIKPGTIKMSAGKVRNNKNGSGVFLYNGANFELSGGEISSNTAGSHPGGGVAIYNNTTGTFTMTGGTISGHTASGHHGIAQTTGGGTLEIKGGTIKNNGSTGVSGGGIYASVGEVKISGGTIGVNGEPNTATDGGGVYVNGSTLLEISGSANIQYNTAATSGGGVFVHGTSTTFKFSGGSVSNNTNTGGNGGGLWIGELKSFSMTNGTVDNNTTAKAGGGMFFNRPITTNNGVTGGTITNNTASTYGGGIYVGNYGGSLSLSVKNATISGNNAQNGGGIAAFEEDAYPERHVELSVGNCTVIKNSATVNGGGLYAYKSKITVSSSSIGRITANNTNEGNTAGSLGGGVCFYLAESSTISNSVINGNTASTNAGGGICVDSTVVTMSGNNEVKSNTAAMYGGGIVVRSDSGTAKLSINTTDSGTTTINGNSISQYDGGGVHVGARTTFEMKNGTISENTNSSQRGGGIDAQGAVILTDTTVSKNESKTGGGGVCVRGSEASLSITGGSFQENVSAAGNGGGLYLENISSTATVSGTTFHLNTALFETPDMSTDSNGKYNLASISSTGNGGAIYVQGETSVVEISGATIGKAVEGGYSNQAINGGGIAVMKGANVSVTSSDIAYNYALRTGGGGYVLGCGGNEPKVTTTLKLIGGSVKNNRAAGSTVYDGPDPQKSAIAALGSEMGGGGLYLRGLSNWEGKTITVEIDGTAFNNNNAYRGAAMYIHESTNLTVKNNASFTKNNAGGLGGVLCFIKNNSTASFTDCSFTENSAALRGGALYIQTKGISIERCTFTLNTATNFGGAIMMRDTTGSNINLIIKSTDFIGNSANNGGAISTSDGATNSYDMTLTLTDCDFTGNRATANGGAILVGNKVTLGLTGGYLTGNTAGVDESGIEPIASNQGAGITGIGGAGGAVAVFDGTFNYTVNATNKGAIYGNTATVVGDDVFSNGSPTSKLNLPAVSTMDLTGFEYEADKTPDWFEDYAKGEVSGMNSRILSSERFRFSDNSIQASLDKINTSGTYVAITVGVSVNLGELIITKSGTDIDPNQVFVFKVSGVSDRSGDTIELTVSITGTGSVKIVDLPVGDYTVSELTSWSWRYGVTTIEVDGSTVQITNNGTSVRVEPDHIDHSVEFTNSLQNNKWLSHGTAPIKNVPANNAVAYNEMVLDLPKNNIV